MIDKQNYYFYIDMKNILKLLTIIVTLMLPAISFGQSDEPKNKHHEKAEKKRAKDAEKAEKEILKKHEKLQDKETRKRMKKTKSKSKRLKSGKPEDPFYKKWFRKK